MADLTADEIVKKYSAESAPAAQPSGMTADDIVRKYAQPTAGPQGAAQPSAADEIVKKYGFTPAPPPQPKGNLLTGGVAVGWNELQGWSDLAIAAGAGAIGAKDTQQEYIKAGQEQFREAQQYVRPELELAPWQQGFKWSNLPAQIVYQASKQIPMTAATLGAGGLIGGALERAGIQALPKFAAGALSEAAEDIAGKKISAAAIQKAAQPVATTTAASYPLSVGSVYQEQVEKGDMSPGAAVTTGALAIPHALLGSLEVGQLKNLFSRGMPSAATKKGLLEWMKGTAGAAAKAAAGETAAEFLQTGIEQSVRTDLTPAQKASAMLQGAFMGGLAGFGLGGGAHVVGSVLSPTKNVRPDEIDTGALRTVVDTALNPQTARQRLDANVEAMTGPGSAPAQRPEPTIGPQSGMPQGAPGPGEVAIDVSPEDRIRGGVEPMPAAAAPVQQNVAPAATNRVDIPGAPAAPLSTARAAAPQPGAPMAHLETSQLEQMLQQAVSPQVQAQIQQEINLRQAPAQPAAPTFEQNQADARRQLVQQFELTGQAAREAERLDITHPLEAMGVVQAKIAERVNRRQSLTALQQKMNEAYGLVDSRMQPQSLQDLQDAQAREQLVASTATDPFVREDAEYRATQIGKQIENRAAVQAYTEEAAQRPATAIPTASTAAAQEGAPEAPRVPHRNTQRAAARAATREAGMTGNREEPFQRAFLAAVNDPDAAAPTTPTANAGFQAGREYISRWREERAPAAPVTPEVPAAPAAPDVLQRARDLVSRSRAERLNERLATMTGPERTQFNNGARSAAGGAPLMEGATEASRAGYEFIQQYDEAQRLVEGSVAPEAPAAPAAPTEGIRSRLEPIPVEFDDFTATGQSTSTATGAKAPIVRVRGRPMVTVDIGGTRVPFYISTGMGGKKDVPPGKWYPFFGFGKDGWFNKTAGKQITDYYGSPKLRAIAEQLDAEIGDVRNDPNVPDSAQFGGVSSHINRDLSPVEYDKSTGRDVADYIRGVVDRIENPAQETPSAVQEPSPTGVYVQPTPEARGAVGEGNAQGSQAPRPQVQPGQAPEITERPTRPETQNAQVERDVEDMSAPATARTGYAGSSQTDKAVTRLTAWMQRAEAYSTTLWTQVQRFGKLIPALNDLWRASTLRDAFEAQLAQVATGSLDKFSQLQRTNPNSVKWIERIAIENRNGLDARKPWAAHTWLHSLPNAAEYQRRHQMVRADWSRLSRAGHAPIYNSLVDLNTTMWTLAKIATVYRALQKQFRNNPQLAPALAQRLERLSPVNTYLESSATRDLASTAVHFENLYTQIRQLARDYTAGYPTDINSPELKKAMQELDQQDRDYRRAPYFHLGRSGNHSVSFELPTVENGLVDKAAADRVVSELAKVKMDQFEIDPLGTNPKVYIMVDNAGQRETIVSALKGMVDDGTLKNFKDGPIYREGAHNAAPSVIQSLIAKLEAAQEADPDAAAENARTVRVLQKYAGEMLGENDARKSLIRRKNIEGFDRDIIRSMAGDIESRVRMLGRVAGTPAVSDALAKMRAQARNATGVTSPDYKDRDIINSIAMQRQRFEIEVGLAPANKWVTMLTGVNYSRNMGLNVSSATLQLLSIIQFLGPVLMMRPGVSFAKAYKAIGAATGPTINVMRSIVSEATSQRSLQQWFDAPLTTSSIENADISPELKQFLILYNNMYGAGANSLARELGHLWNEHEYGSNVKSVFGTAQKMSTALVYYAELMSRLVAAISAYEAYSGDKTSADGLRKAVAYAGEVNASSMFDYSQSNVSQLMSRAGPLKEFTPLAGAFMKFQAMLSEALILNTGRALGIDNYANPEQQAAARRFMGGYLAATITLAGVLGLPLVNALAPGWDKLMDEFAPDEGPHDIRSWLITFIGDMTGSAFDAQTAAQITRGIVEGVPATLGTSLQSRVGQQDIFPLTSTLLDSPKPIKDRLWDVFRSVGGSPIETFVDMVSGVFQAADGEYEAAAKSIMGGPAKNTIAWWRMLEDGKYRDAQGKVLPIEDADTLDAYRRLLGFTSTGEAEYKLERSAMDRREKPLEQDAARIVNGLALSRQNGDMDAYDKYAEQARDFRDRTGENLIARGNRLYQRRKTDLRNAERSGTPLRAPKKDRGLADVLEGYRSLRENP